MLIKMSTDKSVSGAAAALQAAVAANRFGVMQVHNLKETMAKKGVEFAHECLIFEVCQAESDIPAEVRERLDTADNLSDEDRKTIVEIARKALAGFATEPDTKSGAEQKPEEQPKREAKATPEAGSTPEPKPAPEQTTEKDTKAQADPNSNQETGDSK